MLEPETKKGGTALIYAVQRDQSETIGLLIAKSPDIKAQMVCDIRQVLVGVVSAQSEKGKNALLLAAQKGYCEAIELLLAKGADVMAQDKEGRNALIWAVQTCQSAAIELLIAKSTDIKPQITPQVLGVLLGVLSHRSEDSANALILAASKGHCMAIELLLAKGVIVDAQSRDGTSALMDAVCNGQSAAIELLIAKGANINAQKSDGRTALMLAALKGDCASIKLLIAKGADIEAQMKEHGSNALMLAAENGHTAAIDLLISKGAAVATQRPDGTNALMCAAQNGHCPSVELLINKGALVNAVKKNGVTALMLAAIKGHCAVMKLLIINGANIEAALPDSRTALTLATQAGKTDAVTLLAAGSKKRKLLLAFCTSVQHDNSLLDTLEGTNLLRAASKIGGTILQDAVLNFALQNKDMPHEEVIATVRATLADLTDAKAKNPQMDMHVAAGLITGREVKREDYTIRTTEGNLERVALYVDKDTGDVVSTQKLKTPVLHLDALTASFNAFMKLAHDCSSNLQAFGAGLIEQANSLLNKLLDAARETTADAIMITSLLDLIDAVNSGAGHLPLPPRKPDDSDGGGDSGGYDAAGDKLPEAPSGYGAVGLSGNSSAVNCTDFI